MTDGLNQALTKKELLETRRETARMRSDMRVSISTEATRPLGIQSLLERFDASVFLPYLQRCHHSRGSVQKATQT